MVVRFVALPVVRRARHRVFLCISLRRARVRACLCACAPRVLVASSFRSRVWFSGAADFPFFFGEKKCKRQIFDETRCETTIDLPDRGTFTHNVRRLRACVKNHRRFTRGQKSRSFFFFASRSFWKRERERTTCRTRTYPLAFCFSLTFVVAHARQTTPRAHFFTRRREEEDDDDDDEFKGTDERTRVYYVHLHGRDDEKKKISKQSRGCSFESDE